MVRNIDKAEMFKALIAKLSFEDDSIWALLNVALNLSVIGFCFTLRLPNF